LAIFGTNLTRCIGPLQFGQSVVGTTKSLIPLLDRFVAGSPCYICAWLYENQKQKKRGCQSVTNDKIAAPAICVVKDVLEKPGLSTVAIQATHCGTMAKVAAAAPF
jgi:hypothetical protein